MALSKIKAGGIDNIAAALEAASDSNKFTDADHSKLNAIEASATADQTVIVNPFNVEISRFSTAKLTPAKPALAGTVFSATVAEVLAPDASGFAIASFLVSPYSSVCRPWVKLIEVKKFFWLVFFQ